MIEAVKMIMGLAVAGGIIMMFANLMAYTFGSPSSSRGVPSECWIEWDGRTNPTVCD